MVDMDKHVELGKKTFESLKKDGSIWNWIIPSYLNDLDSPRIDCYQNTKENRVIMAGLMILNEKLDKLMAHVIPNKEDKSKCLVSMKESMSCVQPSNHGRKGTMPRSREGCFKKKEVGIIDNNPMSHPEVSL